MSRKPKLRRKTLSGSLKKKLSGTKHWLNQLSRHSSKSTKSVDDGYEINMDGYKRKQRKQAASLDSSLLDLHLSHVEFSLQRAVEAEQNTRRLTNERISVNKKEQQQISVKKKEQKKVFDIAILINKTTNKYYKILCGPIIYEVFYGYIHFADCEQYIQNDIDILNESALISEELEGNQIFEYFCNDLNNANDVRSADFHFGDVSKCLLYRFHDVEKWENHKYAQKNTHCDVFIVVNKENEPMYVLLDVNIDLIGEKIDFHEVHLYQNGDVHFLGEIGTRFMDFMLDESFLFYKKSYDIHRSPPYNFSNGAKATFKFGICYKFSSKYSRRMFYHQTFDIAVAMNEDDEFIYVLNDIDYDLINKTIKYKQCSFYRNGDYKALAECGQEVKCIKIKKFKMKREDESKYNLNSFKKCVLFYVHNMDGWKEHIQNVKTSQFDIATITDSDEYQRYILFDVIVNWSDRVIDYKMCDALNAQHFEIIENYGELITNESADEFVVTNLMNDGGNEKWSNVCFYQLNSRSHSTTRRSKSRKKRSKKKKRRTHTIVNRADIASTKKRIGIRSEKEMKRKHKKQLSNQVSNTTVINEEMNTIWYGYIDIFGFPPDNADQLKAFSRLQNQSKVLSFFEARDLFKYHMQIKSKSLIN